MRLLGSLFLASVALTAQQPPAPATPTPTAPAQRIDSLRDVSSELERLSRRVHRAVVQIFSSGYSLSQDEEGGRNTAVVTRQRATGSGVVLSADGFIVTNSHVVSNARTIRVRVAAERTGRSTLQPEGKLLDARIVGIDRDSDLAVLKVEKTGMSFLELGDSDTLRQGQLVMAFGNPMGLENSVSIGIVSATARQIKADDAMIYIQTDAPINPGNSGGPLINVNGRVVGLNTFIFTQSGGNEGLGFAIPSNIVKNVYTQIRAEGHVHRSEIGVLVQTITPSLATALRLPQDYGVLLADVEPDEAADDAGLMVGDIILSLNGKPMENARQFEVNLYRYRIGDKVKVEVLRGGSKLTYTVAVTEREDDPMRFADMVDPTKNLVPKLGILGVDIDKKIAEMLPDLRKKYGIVVAARGADSSYSGDALQLGDVIYSVNTEPVTTVDALRKILDTFKEDEPLVLQVEREGKLRYLTLTME